MSMISVSAFVGGSLTNHLDLGSNFAGTTSGISTTISGVSSIISPLIVGALTNDNQTLTQWHIVFYIAIGIALFGYVFFMIFGTVEEQPWNKIGCENTESEKQEISLENLEDVKFLKFPPHDIFIQKVDRGLLNCIPTRYVLAAMCFLAVFMEYLIRGCMSVVIVAMVKTTTVESSQNISWTTLSPEELDICPGTVDDDSTSEENGEFDWDEELQGHILSVTGYGGIVTNLLGGRLSETFGPKYVFGFGVLLTGILTMLCPVAARWDVSAFLTVRVIIGLTAGVNLPAMNVLIAKWYSVQERQLINGFIVT
ncbi:hypothetical protein L9F63_002019, partial [Diploptera punctata]